MGFFDGLLGKAEAAIRNRSKEIDKIVDAGNKQAEKSKTKKKKEKNG